MYSLQKSHYKEVNPIQTVTRLKAILEDMQIELEESWIPKSSIDTYSLRLTIKGTKLGTNGKGVTKEYALASAYAEFFERYQNNILLMTNIIWKKTDGFRYFPDERKMTSLEIVRTNSAFLDDMYFSQKGLGNASLLEKTMELKKLNKIDYHVDGEDDLYTVLPFYSVKKGRTEYIPYNIYFNYYGSNGMCGGNTPEEALVQGLSEIFERFVQKKLFTEKLSLPDIPEEYIKRFPYVYKMYQELQKEEGIKCKIKDCSLGGQYPVVALITIRMNTGKYGVKLGCHPDFGVAMERAFTEATQGMDIASSADRSTIDFRNNHVQDRINIYNSYKYGVAQYPYEILLDTPTFPFVPFKDVSCYTNKEIMSSMMELILSMNHDILIRDVSSLGFPSYHIIVPGMSEMLDITDIMARSFNTKIYVARLLNNPILITKENCRYIIGTMQISAPSQIENTMTSHYCLPISFSLPGEEFGLGWAYLVAMCYALINNYMKAADYLQALVEMAESHQSERSVFYKAVYYYLDGMASIGQHKKVIQYLQLVFDTDICTEIDSVFINPEQIITKQYPLHRRNMEECCNKSDCCDYDAYFYCLERLRKKQLENPINQDDLGLLFQELKGNTT